MMNLYEILVSHGSWPLLVFLVPVLAMSWRLAQQGRRRPALIATLLTLVHLALAIAFAGDPGHQPPGELRFAIDLTASAAWVVAAAHLIFDILLARWGIIRPVIIRDLTIIGLVGLCGILAASRAGFALSGVIATSAVLTAVIGLSLQDTLGNVIGGISLQLDQSLEVGDWIKVADMKGRVVQIGWRCTTIETNDWETILLPNSVLMRGSVVVLARRSGCARLWRRWVRFNVSMHVPPAQIIKIVESALAGADLPHRAAEPAPSCICTGVDQGCASYAVRYWLTDPLHDDSMDSRVRSVVVASLAREGHALTASTQGIEFHRAREVPEVDLRDVLMTGIPLFKTLTSAERTYVTQHLTALPVATGERLMRAGEPGDCMFIVASGKFSVEISGTVEDQRIGVARLGRGMVIGEMSLLTGEPRIATVTALTDSLCYRLGRTTFTTLTTERPELLEQLSRLLSQRQESNEAAQRQVATHAVHREEIGHGSRILQRMRDRLKPTEEARASALVEVPVNATVVGMVAPDRTT